MKSRIMGLDFGVKRIGIAVTDENNIIASAHSTISTKEIDPVLFDLIEQLNIGVVVIGLPLSLKGTKTPTTVLTDQFSEKLAAKFPNVVIERIDERYTSKIATEAIRASGAKKKKRRDKELLDKLSAVLILQSYLETI